MVYSEHGPRRISTGPFSTPSPSRLILFFLVPLLAFPPSASDFFFFFFFYRPSSSGPFASLSLSLLVALAPVALSLYIQPVDRTSVLRTTPDGPRPGHCASSAPLGAPSPRRASELFVPRANPVAPVEFDATMRFGLVVREDK